MQQPVVLYLHLPKTGGTTLNQWIFAQTRAPDVPDIPELLFYSGVFWYPAEEPFGFFHASAPTVPEEALRLLASSDLRAVLGHFTFGLHELVERNCQYLTLLRDPVERILSLYHHLSPPTTIDDFVKNYVTDGHSADHTRVITDNDQTRRIAGTAPRFRECNETTLALAKENLRRHFAVVGTTERFDDALVLARRRFQWRKDIPYTRKRVSGRKTAADKLTSQTYALIREFNQYDIQLHQFAGELLEEAIAAEGSDFEDERRQFARLCQSSGGGVQPR